MPSTVAAAVLTAQTRPLELRDVVLPTPAPGQVRVRVVVAGLCHSDVSLADGTLRQSLPAVLGHEGAGVVVELGGDDGDLAVGDHVVFNWAPACGACRHCARAEPYLCSRGRDDAAAPYAALVDGTPVYPGLGPAAFAEETVVPAAGLVPVPAEFPLEQAALIGCAVLTGAGAVLNSAQVQRGESVCVIGLGGVGLCAIQGARIAGAEPIIAVDVSPATEELARRSGATEFVLASDDLPAQVRELTDGAGVDHAIEAVGRAGTIRQAWDATRRGGRATVVGVGSPGDELSFNALEIPFFGRTLVGSIYGSSNPLRDIPRFVEHAQRGELDLAALITDEVDLAGIEVAFERMARGEPGRTLVRPG